MSSLTVRLWHKQSYLTNTLYGSTHRQPTLEADRNVILKFQASLQSKFKITIICILGAMTTLFHIKKHVWASEPHKPVFPIQALSFRMATFHFLVDNRLMASPPDSHTSLSKSTQLLLTRYASLLVFQVDYLFFYFF